MIDAYFHAGGPRFGAADLALRECDRHSVSQAVLVLPPSCPDFATLWAAREAYGARVRLVGIPFGDSAERRLACTLWQIDQGVLGLRLMPDDIRNNLDSLEALGRSGRWLFAINAYDHPDVCNTLLSWLDRHTHGRIMLPHCLKAGSFVDTLPDVDAFCQLLAHPRVSAILSRQGNTGTRRPYPFTDLCPWINDVVSHLGWSRICWGSEYPVLYWRDETMPQAQVWLHTLYPEEDAATWKAVHHDNAQRLLFDTPAPHPGTATAPTWLAKEPLSGLSNVWAQKGISLPAHVCDHLLRLYLDTLDPQQPEPMSAWLARWIAARVEQ